MLTFQDLILKLSHYWCSKGCLLMQPYDIPKGAGTYNPASFFTALGPEPGAVCFTEPSRRPRDGRYGRNPHRLEKHYQFQVVIKPSPDDILELYFQSLVAIGINPRQHDLRLEEDNWESPTLGAHGLGWQVLLDGIEITQFTYFQTMGGLECHPVSAEITYGLERIAMYLCGVDSIYDIPWNDCTLYGAVRLRDEYEHTTYDLEQADVEMHRRFFGDYEAEAKRLTVKGLYSPALDQLMLAAHSFNLLDARGALGVAERADYMGRIRGLAKQIALGYVRLRKEMGFPGCGETVVAGWEWLEEQA
jgi:glycyl-tRNA synthetase alpha chain